ncbi:hypothetical protein DBR28_14000 [Chryseobacterium sp. HMWF028]|nr:hypothetical protein DBR28_14000 [Chryseobacterium sp. HMWF028]
MSSRYEGTLRPTYMVDNIGYFNYKKNKIIITQPYRPLFTIVKEGCKLNELVSDLKPPYYDGNDYQKGLVYKIKDLNHLERIDGGNLQKYFKPMAEYEHLPPPPAKE